MYTTSIQQTSPAVQYSGHLVHQISSKNQAASSNGKLLVFHGEPSAIPIGSAQHPVPFPLLQLVYRSANGLLGS